MQVDLCLLEVHVIRWSFTHWRLFYIYNIKKIVYHLSYLIMYWFLFTSHQAWTWSNEMCFFLTLISEIEKPGGSAVVECLTRDRRVAVSSLTWDTALCPWGRHFILCLVQVQPRKTCPNIIEKNVDLDVCFVCLIWFFTSTQQSFSYAGRVFLGWTSTKLG